jgi:hypothetical protein
MCGVAEGALALAAVSTAMGAYGMYAQGQQQKAQAEYQAAVANNNAIIAEQNAQDALQRGRVEEQQHRLKVAQMKGTQRSVLAASGVQVDTGSALDVVADTAMMGELDALTIRNNAEREAYQHRMQASNYQAESGLYSLAARNAARNGAWGAATSLLGGAAQVGMNYSYMKSYQSPAKTTRSPLVRGGYLAG